jgi:SRSO17 transposase
VARQYSGTLGKVGNCQVGVSVHAVTDHASAALDWRLFLPDAWDDACADDPIMAERIRRRRVWHRHVTLVAAAHLFLTTLRLTSPKATGTA